VSRQAGPAPGPGEWTLELYETSKGYEPFAAFYDSLSDYQRAVLDILLEEVLARQGHNVCSSAWGKNLKEGLYELRVRQDLAAVCQYVGVEPPANMPNGGQVLLRVFFAVYGAKVVLLLGGYDKGRDPSEKRQNKEIALARKMLTAHKEARKRQG
jgi:hypothetical protein